MQTRTRSGARLSRIVLPLVLSLAPAWSLLAPARGAAAPADAIDDPKLARRLGSRVSLEAVGDPAATTSTPPTPRPTPTAWPTTSPTTTIADAVPGPARAADGRSVDAGLAATATAGSTATAPPSGAAAGRTPVFGLGYRRFSFVQVGATDAGSTVGAAASEPFDSVALDFYPISRTLRFGLSTQYGWQSGRFNSRNGDYFIAQSASLGVQLPGANVTPFAEAFAGAGYLRRFQFDRTIPTAYWQFGLDAGANFFASEHGYVSLALGYLRPVNGFAKMQSFTSVYVDTWSLKLGFGY